ncbi:MAG: hypothetical protein HXX17_07100 [Geobacteraceae bacterium]|nr:hypothetical protein [Geobacteraceae bacterium]
MKKVVLLSGALLLTLGMLSGQAQAASKKKATEKSESGKWYTLDLKSGDFQCDEAEGGMTPELAKMAGATVKDNGNGFFTISFEGSSFMMFDSKKTCEKAGKVLKADKN